MGGGEERPVSGIHPFQWYKHPHHCQRQIKEVTSLPLCRESGGEMPDDPLWPGAAATLHGWIFKLRESRSEDAPNTTQECRLAAR